jgi:hypothetical protein
MVKLHIHSSPLSISVALLSLASLIEARHRTTGSGSSSSSTSSTGTTTKLSKPLEIFLIIVIGTFPLFLHELSGLCTTAVLFFPVLCCCICCCARFNQKRKLKKESLARATSEAAPGSPAVVDEEAQRLPPKPFQGPKETSVTAGPSTSSVREGYSVYEPPPAYTDPDENVTNYTYPPLTVPPPLVHKAYPNDFYS